MNRRFEQRPGLSRLSQAQPDATYYQVFVGEGAAFESTKPSSLTDFTDRSLTCLVVEAAQPIAWSQPADLSYADDQPLPELGGIFRGGSRFSGLAKQDGFNAAFADGTVRWIKRLRSEEDKSQFRSLILRKGNKTESELLQ